MNKKWQSHDKVYRPLTSLIGSHLGDDLIFFILEEEVKNV
jgi:hypothetical protein